MLIARSPILLRKIDAQRAQLLHWTTKNGSWGCFVSFCAAPGNVELVVRFEDRTYPRGDKCQPTQTRTTTSRARGAPVVSGVRPSWCPRAMVEFAASAKLRAWTNLAVSRAVWAVSVVLHEIIAVADVI
jgi:hypothetical protein